MYLYFFQYFRLGVMSSEVKFFSGIHDERSLQPELFLEDRINPLPFILFQVGPAYLLNLIYMASTILLSSITQEFFELFLLNLMFELHGMDIPVTLSLLFFHISLTFPLRVKLVLYILLFTTVV